MSKWVSFVAGLLTGVYVSQTYKIPKVTTMITSVITRVSEYELKNDNQ